METKTKILVLRPVWSGDFNTSDSNPMYAKVENLQ